MAGTATSTTTGYAQNNFTYDRNISPFNQTFSSAVFAVISRLGQQIESVLAPYLPGSLPPSYALTTQEAAAGITSADINTAWEPGDVRRFKPALDGATDDTTPLQKWASVLGTHTFPIVATALISAAIPLVSDSTFDFVEGATIATATTDINLFSLTSLSNVLIRGASFSSSVASTSLETGGIILTGCSNCTVEDCSFTGMQYNGIWGVSGINYCTFRNNRFTSSRAAQLQDSGDIQITTASAAPSTYNVIDGNYCFGGGEFGIAVWDPYAGVLPLHNVIANNRVGNASGYGILMYTTVSGDSWNQIVGNHVDTIYGNISSNTSSGAGIYIEGAGCGGTVVANNTVRNCCIDTANATLAPAGIGVNGGPGSGGVPMTITGNTISDVTQYNGILVTGSNGVSITANTVRMPATQTTIGHGIFVVNSTSVSVADNSVLNLTTTQNQCCIALEAIGASYTDVSITGNTLDGGHSAQIRIIANSHQYSHVSIIGNVCSGGDTNCIPLLLDSNGSSDVVVSGNSFTSQGATAISHVACTNVQYTANYLTGTAAIFKTSGACTGSVYDVSNIGAGLGTGVSNAGTGLLVQQLGTAAPTAGTWAVGDAVRNSAAAVGSPLGWRCTVAGAPGTWTAEINLGFGVTSANPSANVGLSAVNGTATTFLTSDSAPALSTAISPTWLGTHTFTTPTVFTASGGGKVAAVQVQAAAPALSLESTGAGTDSKWWDIGSGGTTQLSFRALNDAGNAASNYLQITRSGSAISAVALGNATDNPSYAFLGTNTAKFSGPISAAGTGAQIIVGTSTKYAWGTGTNYPIVQLAGVGAIMGTDTVGVVLMGGGLYYDGTNYRYGQAGTGVQATLGTGSFTVSCFSTSGTAGGTATPTVVFSIGGTVTSNTIRGYGPSAATLVDMTPTSSPRPSAR